jgi:hypothetical protein
MTGILKVDTIQKNNGTTPTASDLGLNVTGSILQTVSTTKTNTFTSSTNGWIDITDLSVNITPKSSTSKFFITISLGIAASYGSSRERSTGFRILRNGSTFSIGESSSNRGGCHFRVGDNNSDGNHSRGITFTIVDTPSTTSTITYKLQSETEDGMTLYINRTVSDENVSDAYGLRTASTMTVMEIAG